MARLAPAPSARAVATSSAALDDTPTETGTSDVTVSRARGALDHAVAHEHDGDADHVVRPLGHVGQRVAHLRIGEGREPR